MITFSICITAFNRERLIGRAIRSCLAQAGDDYEIVVADDGSTDGTVAAIQAFADDRIRIVCHGTNRGSCAARNFSVEAAAGQWIVMLDSDDALQPKGLESIRATVRDLGAEADCVEFMMQRDDGGCSPDPPLTDGTVNYEQYLRQIDQQRYFDPLRVIRRSAARQTPWREWRVSGVVLHSFDLHREWRCATCSQRVAIVHTDAPNRISWVRRGPAMARQAGADLGSEMDEILSRHGAALQACAPRTWQRFQRVRASYYFLAGRVWAGIRQAFSCLRMTPFSGEVWGQLICGLTGPGWFARIRSRRPPPT